MEIKLLIFFISLILLGILLSRIGIHIEKNSFNNGKCIICGRKLRLFDTTYMGDRGYICDHCGWNTWVSYRCVDKKFLEEE